MANKKQGFLKYCNYLKDALHLKDWKAVITDEDAGYNSLAKCELCYGRKIITIYLSDTFLVGTKEEQRHTLIHELIHAHFSPAHDIAVEQLDEKVKDVFIRLAEHSVDGIADAIQSFFKLP